MRDPNISPVWEMMKGPPFTWDGRLMLREIAQDAVPVRTYLWGLDVVGQVSNL